MFEELKNYTTLKIGGSADILKMPNTVEEFLENIREYKNSLNIVGAGSNLLVSSDGVEGCVVLTKNLDKITQLSDTEFKVECGVKNAMFSKLLLQNSLAKGEFLIGIPGFIGGGIFMNAGAHGENIKDIIKSVEIYDINEDKIVNIDANDISFEYRNSSLMREGIVILSAVFGFEKGDKEKIQERMDFHVNYRAKNHPPLTEPSCGSTFKNPEGEYAANLLEKVGAKEYTHNNRVKFSSKHANFLYNYNNATSTDVLELMYEMYLRVKKQFNIELHPEVKFIGKMTNKEKEIWKTMEKH